MNNSPLSSQSMLFSSEQAQIFKDKGCQAFTPSTTLQLLLIEDDNLDAEMFHHYVKQSRYSVEITRVSSMIELDALMATKPLLHLVFVDYYFGLKKGTDIIAKYRPLRPAVPFIVLTGQGDEKIVTEALRCGAIDYLTKMRLTVADLNKIFKQICSHWLGLSQLVQQNEIIDKQASIIELTSDIVAVSNLQGDILYLNGAAKRLLAVTQTQGAKSGSFFELFPSEQREYLQNEIFPKVKLDHPFKMESSLMSNKGEKLHLSMAAVALCDTSGKHSAVATIMRNTTDNKKKEEQLNYAATHDALTGMVNRKMLISALDYALKNSNSEQESLAVLFIDVDNFKAVNDNLGHEKGDAILCEISRHLHTLVRSEDTVGRMGGDEFVIVLKDYDSADIPVKLAKRIIKKLTIALESESGAIDVSASVGIAYYPQHGRTTKALLKSADSAMYMAKNQGKNQYHELAKNQLGH